MDEDTFRKVAGPKAEQVTAGQVAELVAAPAGSRPRIYALWHDQIVSVPSDYYLERYKADAEAYWVSHTTVADLTRKA